LDSAASPEVSVGSLTSAGCCVSSSGIVDNFLTFDAGAHPDSGIQEGGLGLGWLIAFIADQDHVGRVDRGFFLDPSCLSHARLGLHVPGNQVYTLDKQSVLFGKSTINAAGLALFLACDDQHGISGADPH